MKTSTILLLGGGAVVAFWLYRRKATGQASVSDLVGSALARGVVPDRSRGPLPPAPREYIPGQSPPPPSVRAGGPGQPRSGTGEGKLFTPGVVDWGTSKTKAPGGGPVAGPGSVNRTPERGDLRPPAPMPTSGKGGGPGYARFVR